MELKEESGEGSQTLTIISSSPATGKGASSTVSKPFGSRIQAALFI
jgi:hypothetical protein